MEERDEAEVMALAADACLRAGWGKDLIDAYQDDVRSLSAALQECQLGATVRIENTPERFAIAEGVPA